MIANDHADKPSLMKYNPVYMYSKIRLLYIVHVYDMYIYFIESFL